MTDMACRDIPSSFSNSASPTVHGSMRETFSLQKLRSTSTPRIFHLTTTVAMLMCYWICKREGRNFIANNEGTAYTCDTILQQTHIPEAGLFYISERGGSWTPGLARSFQAPVILLAASRHTGIRSRRWVGLRISLAGSWPDRMYRHPLRGMLRCHTRLRLL